jgi:uncharacterized protein YqeY
MLGITINADKIKYMKEKKAVELSAVRLILSETQNRKIELKRDLTNEETFVIIQKLIKQVEESLSYAKKANDEKKILEYETQIEIFKSYLPKQMTEDEIRDVIQEIILNTETSARTMGNIMKSLMPKIQGKADTKLASKIAKEMLQ